MHHSISRCFKMVPPHCTTGGVPPPTEDLEELQPGSSDQQRHVDIQTLPLKVEFFGFLSIDLGPLSSCPLQDLERSSTVSPTQTLGIPTSFSGSEVCFGGPSWCFGRGGTQQYSATRRAPAEVGLELPNDICAAAQWDSICFQSTKWCCDAAPPVSTKTLINTRARLTFGEIQYYDAYTACTYIKHIYIYILHIYTYTCET